MFFLSHQTLTAQYSTNYAGSFNGFSSYVAFPNSSDFNPVGAITLEAWVNPTSLIGNTMAVIGKNYQSSYFLGIQSSGRVVFYPRGGQSFRSRVNSVIQANKWTHIAATYDGSLTAIYINGVLDTSSTGYSGAIGVNTDSLFIGADRIGAATSLFFYGKLENVRLWAIARNAFVISEHRFIPLEVIYPTGYYSDLRLSLQLDGDFGSYSGNNFYFGFNRNVSVTNYSNKGVNYLDYNNSLVLNGISDYFSAAPTTGSGFNPTTGITLESWIRRDTTGTQPAVQNILNKSGGTTRYNYGLLLYSSGSVLFALNSEGFTLGTPALITNGQWTHVAATYSSLTGKAVIYINGDSVAGSTYSGNPLIQSNNDAVYIGGIGASNYSSNRFKGQIDGVRIWNYQRTGAHIRENMYKAAPPIAGLTFFNFDKYTNAIYSEESTIFSTTTFAGLSHISSSHLGKAVEKTSPMLSDVTGGYYSPGFTTSRRRFFVPDVSAVGITDSLFVSSGGDVSNLKVFVLMNHTYLSDMEVLLISPAGSAISLFNRRAGNGDDMMTIFSDGADSNASVDNNLNSPGITAPFSPAIKPLSQLSFLNGQNKFGWWKLKLIDYASGDHGYVHGWGINQTGAADKTVILSSLVQGFYNSSLDKTVRDTMKVFLRHVNSPYPILDTAKSYFDSTGKGSYKFDNISFNDIFYFVLKHRNSIETWSSAAYQFSTDILHYNFTLAQSQAYGSNQVFLNNSPTRFAIFNGDVNQDDIVDSQDIVLVYNDMINFNGGYLKTDLTGDNFTDVSDLVIAFNNSNAFVSKVTP